MKERVISQDEAVEIMRLWQEGQVVIAQVINKDHFLTTVLDLFAFDSIKLIESGNAITFAEPVDSPDTFRSVTIACRRE